MADTLNTQLARIVAPNINEVDYANSIKNAFETINENFKKIASLPFIQGVQGDSYKLVENKVFENSVLTEEGAVLLNSIFSEDITNGYISYFSAGNTFEYCNDIILASKKINNVSPITYFFNNGTDTLLYFYAIYDDSGKINEKQLGQYFYFVDSRLKVLGESYYDYNNDLDSFFDYTGFYKYEPGENPKYVRTTILPTIYYDKEKNDICWKFNGQETGISAIGVAGSDGKDSNFQFVKVLTYTTRISENYTVGSGKVEKVFVNGIWKNVKECENLKDGLAVICIEKNNSEKSLAYGEIHQDGDWNAYWNSETILDPLLSFDVITNYFFNMGTHSSLPNHPYFIAIPEIQDRRNPDTKAHIIRSGGTSKLIFEHGTAYNSDGTQLNSPITTNSSITPNPLSTIEFNNYTVKIDSLSSSNDGLTVTGKTKLNGDLGVTGNLNVFGNTYMKGKSNASNTLEVEGTTKLKGNASINGKVTIDSFSSSNDGLIVKGKTKITGEVGVTGSVIVSNDIKSFNNKILIGNLESSLGTSNRVGIKLVPENSAFSNKYIYCGENGQVLRIRTDRSITSNNSIQLLAGAGGYGSNCAAIDLTCGTNSSNDTNDTVKIKPYLQVDGDMYVTNSALLTQKFGYWDTKYITADSIPASEDYWREGKLLRWNNKFNYGLDALDALNNKITILGSVNGSQLFVFKKPFGVISLNNKDVESVVYFGFKSDIYPERCTVFIRCNDEKGKGTPGNQNNKEHYLHLMANQSKNVSLHNNCVYMCILYDNFTIGEKDSSGNDVKYRKMDVFKIGDEATWTNEEYWKK